MADGDAYGRTIGCAENVKRRRLQTTEAPVTARLSARIVPTETPADATERRLSKRLASATRLLTTLQRRGAKTDAVRLVTHHHGLALAAAAPLRAGDTILTVPASCVLRATHAPPSLLSTFERLGVRDARLRLQLLLLHERSRAASSEHHDYADALPGDELTHSLPVAWDQHTLAAQLAGTPLFDAAVDERLELVKLHTRLAPSYNLADLMWAHAVFWSRAIRVPLPSSDDECLVPLLDLCNHSSGSAAELAVERTAVGELELVLRAGTFLAEGDEVCISYGAKANGELLRRHGFVLEGNMSDVYPIELAKLARDESRIEELRRLRLKTKIFLHRGGLPEAMLKVARVLCVDQVELQVALLEASGKGESMGPAFDWNAVDWAAESDDGELAIEGMESGVSASSELRTLDALVVLISGCLERVEGVEGAERRARKEARLGATDECGVYREGSEPSAQEEARPCVAANCGVYREGLRAILSETLTLLARRRARITCLDCPAELARV